MKPTPPDYLRDAYEGTWYVYAPDHDHDEAWVVDDPEALFIEDIWLRHVPPPPPGERGDQEELFVRRDTRGRWMKAWWWEPCAEGHPDAQPFLEVRYRP